MKKATKATLGAGAAAAGAAAAYYLYGSKNAAAHRRMLKKWAQSAERDVAREARKFKDAALNEDTINSVIQSVADRYEAAKNLDAKDVRAFVGQLQKGWREARSYVQQSGTARRGRPVRKARKNSRKITNATQGRT